MTAHRQLSRPSSPAALEFDRAAAHLDQVLDASCNLDLAFDQQLNRSLAAALRLISSDPQLADLLTEPDFGRSELAGCYGVWIEIYARRLRLAAERSPRPVPHPEFVEPFLIAAISAQIRRSLQRGYRHDPRLLAGLEEFVHAYYSVAAANAALPTES